MRFHFKRNKENKLHGGSDYGARETRRNLRELEMDEMNNEERVDEIWQRIITAEAELPYGYFDAIAATTEV